MGAGAAKQNKPSRSNSLRAFQEAQMQRFLATSEIEIVQHIENSSIADLQKIPTLNKANRSDSLGDGGQVLDWEYSHDTTNQPEDVTLVPTHRPRSMPMMRKTVPSTSMPAKQLQQRVGGSMVLKKSNGSVASYTGSGSFASYKNMTLRSVRAPLVELSRRLSKEEWSTIDKTYYQVY